MRELYINENDADQRVDKFLMKTFKTMPKSLMYKYIRNKKIKVNRKRCEISQRLAVGDTLQCFISEEFFDGEVNTNFLKAKGSIDIVYEDEHLLIVNKEAGLLCHSDQMDDHDTLIDRILKYLYQKQEYLPNQEQSFTPALANRIDRNTSGLVLAAKDAPALRELNELLKEHALKKYYHCIVQGVMKKKEELLILYHQKQDGNISDICSEKRDGYKEVKTGYRVLKQKRQYALLEIDLQSGKSHQIRTSLAYIHHPLLGDVKYGGKKNEKMLLPLCACELYFPENLTVKTLDYMRGKRIKLPYNPVDDYFEKEL